MAVRIEIRRFGGLSFDDFAIGPEFLDICDKCDDLCSSEVIAQGSALEIRLVWQIDFSGDE